MAKQTPEEKELARQARAQRKAAEKELARQAHAERQQRITERRQRSEQAMAAGPDVYAKRIIASWLQVPFIHFFYSLLYIVFDYVFGGHIVVKNWQKLLVKTGYISEGALGVAGVWALVNHVAIIHNLLASNPLTKQIIDPMNGFMMAAFTLIPDLILASAILMTFARWADCRPKEGRVVAVLWALLYSGCTITFFCLTIYTLSTVGSVASSGDITKVIYASGTELQIRVISSFIYSLSEVIYAHTHKGHNSASFQPAKPPAPVLDVEAIVNKALTEQTAKNEQVMRDLAEQQHTEIQRLLVQVDELKQRPETPQIAAHVVSEETIVNTIMKQLEDRFETLLSQQARVSGAGETLQIAGPAVSEETIVNTVMKHLDARLETFKAQQTRVSAVREAEGAGSPRIRKQSASSAPEQENGASNEAIIHKYLEKDRGINHRKLSTLTGISESTCYRIRKAWIAAHPVVASNPNEVVEDEENEEDEAVM